MKRRNCINNLTHKKRKEKEEGMDGRRKRGKKGGWGAAGEENVFLTEHSMSVQGPRLAANLELASSISTP